MADDNFRSYRNRDPLPRDEPDRSASDPGDPLAELARLIGQTDPYAEAHRNETHGSGRAMEDAHTQPEQDWAADETYAEEDYADDDRYAPPASVAPPVSSHSPYPAQEPKYDGEPPSGERYFSGQAREFGGFRDEPQSNHRDPPIPALRPRELPAYADFGHEEDLAEESAHGDEESYAEEDYYDESPAPRRRGPVVVIMAVLGLAVVGSAGAFGYRAMFGGSMLPMLPPIIKADNSPNRITPSSSEPNASQSRTAMANPGAPETIVPREEQPVNIEPAKTPARVISSIPVVGGQNAVQPGMTVGQTQGSMAPNVQSSSPWPPPPPMPNVTQTPAAGPAAVPAQTSAEPKRIHTVTIRPDQAVSADTSAMPSASPPPAAAARPSPRPTSTPPKPSSVASAPPANAPLSIVPNDRTGAAPAARVPAATRPMSVASAGPVTGTASAAGGGYAVQVTSQRSEAEAQASFKELRAKYPNQLGGREPVIRRADLGAKGTYYRALIGPFASAQQAAEMCSGLKAAGGNCLVQKN